ncbi:hypothetical protein R1sor_020177 [Riccia sorocarpa]|uniref:Gnk2-homologous domain-containing protein n=1 Tax=Riccia sorocarpa TaxID=122646 RepID=A0ABD3IIF0_9MARC
MKLTMKMVLLLVAMLLALSDAQNTEEKTIICNGGNLPDYDYQQAVLNTLGDVIYNTWDTAFRWKKISNTVNGKKAWAIGACWDGLNKGTCIRCLQVANDKLTFNCGRRQGPSYALGGQVTLQDCRLRYEVYDFDFVTYGADAHDEQPGPNDIVITMECDVEENQLQFTLEYLFLGTA